MSSSPSLLEPHADPHSLQAGKLQEALDKLLVLEKQTRNVRPSSPSRSLPTSNTTLQAADLASTTRVLIAITSLLHAKKEWTLLNSHISLLSKKHGQLRQATQNMVEHVIKYLESMEGKEKLELIETLREVTEGKVRFSFEGSWGVGADAVRLDLLGGTTSARDEDAVGNQGEGGRYHGRVRLAAGATGRDVRVDGTSGEGRFHPRADAVAQGAGGLGQGWDRGEADQHQMAR